MNILETFMILFESDSTDVKKGAKEAKSESKRLEDQLKQTNQAANQVGQSFLRMAKEAAGALAAVFAYSAIFKGIFNAAEYADTLARTASSLGIATEELGAWGRAAQQAGGSAEAFESTLKGLLGRMSQLDVTGKSQVKPFFDELGIAMTDSAGKMRSVMDILPELADKFASMSKQESIGFGKKLGLDEGTIMLLQRGRREVEALIARQKELGVVHQKDAEVAAKYNDALSDMQHVFRILFTRIAGDVLPALTWVIEKFQKFGMWAREHEGFLYGMFSALTAIIGVLAIKAAIAAGAFTIMGAPLYLIIAAIAGIGVVVGIVWDDIKKFSEGAPSVIGKVAEAFVAVGHAIMALWWNVRDFVVGTFDKIMGYVEKFKGMFGFLGGGSVMEMVQKGQVAISNGNTPLAAQNTGGLAAGSTGNKNQQVTVGQVTVNTQATDADGIAKDINKSLSAEMRSTVDNMDDGIAG